MNHVIIMASAMLLGQSMLLGGCSSKGVRLDDVLLPKSIFYAYDENFQEFSCSWVEFDDYAKQQIRSWLPHVLEGAKTSFVTYAPAVIIKTTKYNINITKKEIVCNVEVSDKRWMQYVRELTSEDRRIQKIIKKRFIEKK